MKDYNELNKIKFSLERELDRLSAAIEKIENYIVTIENGNGEKALWNGKSAYSSIEKLLILVEKYKLLSEKLYVCSNYLNSLVGDEII